MDVFNIITAKPVLIGFHLGFAIAGIDAFLWFLGERKDGAWRSWRVKIPAFIGLFSFLLSWIFGGYYYVKFYGSLVKPLIKTGSASWAHNIMMETKEHIFLFIIPLAFTASLITFLNKEQFEALNIKRPTMILAGVIAGIGLAVGILGFMVSAAARWG